MFGVWFGDCVECCVFMILLFGLVGVGVFGKCCLWIASCLVGFNSVAMLLCCFVVGYFDLV